GRKYSDPLKGLQVGHKIFAYLVSKGYVGYGEVTREAQMIKDFFVDKELKPLLQLPLRAPKADENADNPDLSEWVIGVNWLRSYPGEAAKRFRGIFANQNMVCELRHSETVEFLKREFGIS